MTRPDETGASLDRAAAAMADALHGWLRAVGDGDLPATRRNLAEIARLTALLEEDRDYGEPIKRHIAAGVPRGVAEARTCAVELIAALGNRIAARLRARGGNEVAGCGGDDASR